MPNHAEQLAQELNLNVKNVQGAIELIDQGNTIPFIARYRKEATGSMDDQVLRDLGDRLEYLRGLDKRKDEVTSSITEQGAMTPELTAALSKAKTLAEVEDIYRPYKPKRKTRASIAKARGLQPLATAIFRQDAAFDPERAAADYLNDEVPDAAAALAGAQDIIAEAVSDDAACLIGLSPKYQDGINVDWRHGYIPQTVESFGVGLMAVAVFVVLLRFVRGKNWWPKLRPVCSVLLAAGMAFSVVWQRSAARSYEKGGRAYTVFAEGAEAGLADAAGTETPVVTDYPVWGGDLEAENAFFLRYHDQDADAHALQVWRTEDHADDEAVYRLGFTLGQDKHYDIAWCGLGYGANPDALTDVTVCLPAGTAQYAVLYYTTADGEQKRTEVYPAKEATLLTLTGETILADSIRLE